jgi:twitching motility protein PilT
MSFDYSVKSKVFSSKEGLKWSIADMLSYFDKHGSKNISDLHIKVGLQPAYRIDGKLVKLKGEIVTQDIAKALIYPLIGDIGVETLDKEYSYDASYRYGSTQYRINAFIDSDGVSAAIRALGQEVMDPEKIGFPNDVWKDIIELKQGLVIVAGVTGAGKSTTIASLIEKIAATRSCRIVTLEDPIEHSLSHGNSMISQREVGREVKSFSDGLRSMMREDPDVIFIGEIRDPETASMALSAAETGHLVFSTLHTRDVTGTMTRILDFFPAERHLEIQNQLSLGLAYVIGQKLLPRIDGHGRILAMEILNCNYAVANLIRTGKLVQLYSMLQTRIKNTPQERMITLESHMARLAKAGSVDTKEARKWTNDPLAFDAAMKYDIGTDMD